MSVSVQPQAKTTETAAKRQATGPKTVPPKPKQKNDGSDRTKGKGLAATVGEGVQNLAVSATKAGKDVVQESVKGGLTSAVMNVVSPVRNILLNPMNPTAIVINPLLKNVFIPAIAPKLGEYLQQNNIEVSANPAALLTELFFSPDLGNLDGEVAKALDGFIDKALPEKIKLALEAGDLKGAVAATGVSTFSGAKGIVSEMFSMPNSNKFTSFFKFAGQKIPFVNKLSSKFQPWAAGAGIFMFGGLAVRLVVKAFKLLLGGTLLATGGVFAKKIFDKVTKSAASASGMLPQAQAPAGGMGGAMSALAGMTKGGDMPGMAGAGPGGPGMGNMINAASGLMNMLGKK